MGIITTILLRFIIVMANLSLHTDKFFDAIIYVRLLDAFFIHEVVLFDMLYSNPLSFEFKVANNTCKIKALNTLQNYVIMQTYAEELYRCIFTGYTEVQYSPNLLWT